MGRFFRRREHSSALVCLDDALEALGECGGRGTGRERVPVARIVGTQDRWWDFDAAFEPCTDHLRPNLRVVERALRTGASMPPVDLVRLGDLYFVVDGHHRVAAAHRLGRREVAARVHRIATVAWGQACVRARHLPVKTAERRFLERVPLADPVRCGLWLDEPAAWARLAVAAEAWGRRATLAGDPPRDRADFARRWWSEEVVPAVARARHERRTEPGSDGGREVAAYHALVVARLACGR